jgi:hypothetical protein
VRWKCWLAQCYVETTWSRVSLPFSMPQANSNSWFHQNLSFRPSGYLNKACQSPIPPPFFFGPRCKHRFHSPPPRPCCRSWFFIFVPFLFVGGENKSGESATHGAPETREQSVLVSNVAVHKDFTSCSTRLLLTPFPMVGEMDHAQWGMDPQSELPR